METKLRPRASAQSCNAKCGKCSTSDLPRIRLSCAAKAPWRGLPYFPFFPRRGGFAAVFACLKPHFPAEKIFYDLRLDLRFVCYNGCELTDIH